MDGRGPYGGSAATVLAILLTCGLLAACGETARRAVHPAEDLTHPHGGVRMRAVGAVRQTGDLEQVPAVIELLDDSDPGVRAAAGSTLVELTGHDTGYEPWAEPDVLRSQVEAWRAWWSAR